MIWSGQHMISADDVSEEKGGIGAWTTTTGHVESCKNKRHSLAAPKDLQDEGAAASIL